jgi:Protein of unknown function (DUF2442)
MSSSSGNAGMNSSIAETEHVKAVSVRITDETLDVTLEDGRLLFVPLLWYPRLQHGNAHERAQWELIGGGEGIHWPELDEDISVAALLAGRRSGESQKSLQKWLLDRTQSKSQS